MTSNAIREAFLQFFKDKAHRIVPSAPMVVKNDPTLLFVNSGMAPFKEYFLGNAKPKDSRIADTQKCLRVSGKHNDLEEVGYDTYHHTLFEMLGNWSFGDYFKKEAIAWAWELLTEVYGIDKAMLYVTVFEGSDDDDNLEMDSEAYTIWKQYIDEDRILKGNKNDNFWEMGEQGPCGPCSEIHVDIRSQEDKQKIDGRSLVNTDHPQVIEIWNLVFMQYNRKANGVLEDLPNTHIDTGMGFERLCMVLQGVQSNYDTDVFTPIIKTIETVTGSDYGKDEKIDVAIRVIADHVRAVAFSIADGQLPSNTGAGYVIRRILRRAIRYGFSFLNQQQPFIYKLITTLNHQMSDAFPELNAQGQLIENVIREEEQSFLRTLDQGLILLQRLISDADTKEISGEKVFELKGTHGFPEDLTELILKEQGFTYNKKEFKAALEKEIDISKSDATSTTDDWVIGHENEENTFIGYDTLEANIYITRYRKVVSKKDGERYQLVFNQTPFYPEGGGQVGDKGTIESTNGEVFEILDTKKENNVIIHFTKQLPNQVNEVFKAQVNGNYRRLSQSNHTATHLLHQALRTILGTHVEQKGSLVRPQSLRFDFSHFSKVTTEQLQEIEGFVNARIRENLQLEEQRSIPVKEAMSQGAIALFGEKYGDAVRTIRFGASIELCGGTHVQQTSDIWYFKITSESAVASGIRRIEAITNSAASHYFETIEAQFEAVKLTLKNVNEPVKAVQHLQNENATLKKTIERLLNDKAKHLKAELQHQLTEYNGINYLAKQIDLDAKGTKDLCFELGNTYNNLFLLFGSETNGKAVLTCYISKELVNSHQLNAGTIVRELGKYIQGGGGGQPFFATAGGKNPSGINEALSKIKTYLN